MKFTTARRLIKEEKRVPGCHTLEVLKEAHQVCHDYHDKVSRGKAAEDEMAAQVAALRASDSVAAEKALADVPDSLTPEEYAARMVKRGRRGKLNQNILAVKEGRAIQTRRLDTMGNKPLEVVQKEAPVRIKAPTDMIGNK